LEDIQKYYTLTNDDERVEFLKTMISNYFQRDSPVELNLPSTMLQYAKDLQTIVSTYPNGTVVIDSDILDKLRTHCYNDIGDVFGRFKQTAAYQKILKDQEKIKDENELLQKSGMAV
jgi:hypothetical protein